MKPTVRIALGRTIPFRGVYGGIRVDVEIGDGMRPEDGGSRKALAARVRAEARALLRVTIHGELKRLKVTTDRLDAGKEIRWER